MTRPPKVLCIVVFSVCVALLCVSCATQRHQLPQTEQASQQTVTAAEEAYKRLYAEHKAQRLTDAAMADVARLYLFWRTTQGMLIDAIRAGALEWAVE